MTLREFFSKFHSRYLLGNCLGMCVVAIILVVLTLVGIAYYTHHGEEINVPNLRGLSYDQAKEKLESRGLRIEVRDSGYVSGLPQDAVLEQSLPAGSRVKPMRTIYVTINSSSTPTIVLPDIADNSSLREAQTKLKAIGFKLGPVEYINGEKDWVYEVKVNGRNVSAGTRIPINASVVLVAGNGQYDEDEVEVDSAAEAYPVNDGLGVNDDEENTGLGN